MSIIVGCLLVLGIRGGRSVSEHRTCGNSVHLRPLLINAQNWNVQLKRVGRPLDPFQDPVGHQSGRGIGIVDEDPDLKP